MSIERNTIKIRGKIVFDPEDKTKKHGNQSSWKRIAMVMIQGDVCDYYSWFINRRYNLPLTKPLRGAHVSFINDSLRDIKSGLNVPENEAKDAWKKLKKKWDGKSIDIVLDVSPRSDGKHWWLVIPEEDRGEMHKIRKEIGLDRPHYGVHLSLGYAVDKFDSTFETKGVKAKRMNVAHSEYILKLIRKKLIE